MRSVMATLMATVLIASPGVAFAQPSIPDEVIDKLDDPRTQEAIADALAEMVRAMMTVKIAPIAKAVAKIDPDSESARAARRMDDDTTLGDIAAKGDPDYADDMEDGIRRTTRMSGTMMRQMAKMMPVLVGMAKDMGAQMEDAVERAAQDTERETDRDQDRKTEPAPRED